MHGGVAIRVSVAPLRMATRSLWILSAFAVALALVRVDRSAYLYSVFHAAVPEWHFQCISFDGPPDVSSAAAAAVAPNDVDVSDHLHLFFAQETPFPALICVGRSQRCFETNRTHFVEVPSTIVVASRHNRSSWSVTLKHWSGGRASRQLVVGDSRWPFCFGGGGLAYSGLNATATCGGGDDDDEKKSACLDICPDFVAAGGGGVVVVVPQVLCPRNLSLGIYRSTPVHWTTTTTTTTTTSFGRFPPPPPPHHHPWRALRERRPSSSSSYFSISYDTPLLHLRIHGGDGGGGGGGDEAFAFATTTTAMPVPRDAVLCVRPPLPRRARCHALLHGACYQYRRSSVRCIDLSSFPVGCRVAMRWSPALTLSPYQPEGAGTDRRVAHCLGGGGGGGDDRRLSAFLACVSADRKRGTWSLAASSSSSSSPPPLLREVRGRCTTIAVTIVEGGRPAATRQRRRGEGDVALLASWALTICFSSVLGTVAIVCAILRRRRRVEARSLLDRIRKRTLLATGSVLPSEPTR